MTGTGVHLDLSSAGKSSARATAPGPVPGGWALPSRSPSAGDHAPGCHPPTRPRPRMRTTPPSAQTAVLALTVAMLFAPMRAAPGEEHLLVVYIKDGIRTTTLARNCTPSKRSARWVTIAPALGDEFDIPDICHVETVPVGAVTTLSSIRTAEDAQKVRSHLERANGCWRAHPSAREHLRGYISELESDIKRFDDGQRKVNGAWLSGADYARTYRPDLGTNAPGSISFDTRDGRQFRNVEIRRTEATGIVVQHESGVTKIPFDALSDETRAKLDPRFASGARQQERVEDLAEAAPAKGYAKRAPEKKRGVPADGPEGIGHYTVMQVISGAVYHDVAVTRASTNGVVITHSTGSCRLDISDLPDTVLSDMGLPSQADQLKAMRDIREAEREQRAKGLVPHAGEWVSTSELKARVEKIESEKFARMRSDLDYVRPLLEFKRFLPKEVTMVSEERVRAGNALGETIAAGTGVVVLGLDGTELVVPCKRAFVALRPTYSLSGDPFNIRRDVDRNYTARVEEGVGRVPIESTDLAARVIGRLNHPPSVVATEETRVAFASDDEDTVKWPIEAGRILTVVGFREDSDEAMVWVNGREGRIKIAHVNWDQAMAELGRRSTNGQRGDARPGHEATASEEGREMPAKSADAAENLPPPPGQIPAPMAGAAAVWDGLQGGSEAPARESDDVPRGEAPPPVAESQPRGSRTVAGDEQLGPHPTGRSPAGARSPDETGETDAGPGFVPAHERAPRLAIKRVAAGAAGGGALAAWTPAEDGGGALRLAVWWFELMLGGEATFFGSLGDGRPCLVCPDLFFHGVRVDDSGITRGLDPRQMRHYRGLKRCTLDREAYWRKMTRQIDGANSAQSLVAVLDEGSQKLSRLSREMTGALGRLATDGSIDPQPVLAAGAGLKSMMMIAGAGEEGRAMRAMQIKTERFGGDERVKAAVERAVGNMFVGHEEVFFRLEPLVRVGEVIEAAWPTFGPTGELRSSPIRVAVCPVAPDGRADSISLLIKVENCGGEEISFTEKETLRVDSRRVARGDLADHWPREEVTSREPVVLFGAPTHVSLTSYRGREFKVPPGKIGEMTWSALPAPGHALRYVAVVRKVNESGMSVPVFFVEL